ncbi:hypothetical protein DH2020_046301 [Rehmannia glutinosa]|uniref:Elongation factor Ts, mitochondrial n=1 Tax=Rehmannia glutinosa TaxID=99300 RepID=A0ABR0UBN1_REHGL
MLKTHIVSSTGTDVAVEEADLSAVDNEATVTTREITGESSAKSSDANPTQSKRSRPVRKSEMPPVQNEELIPGATFTGKVRSIQPFGAFIDFGAFTDGLVHVSRLSDSFVKDVASVVSVGQEVKVRLVEANMETGRISLSMCESDDGPVSSDKSKPPRKTGQRFNQKKDEVKKSTKFVKGQDLEGTVTLTMKKEEDGGELDSKLSQGTVHTATNPFVLAFRSNKEISAFLDDKKNEDEPVENAPEDAKEEDLQVPLDNSQSNDVEIEASSIVLTDEIHPSIEDEVTEEPAPEEAEENSGEADVAFSSEIVEESTKTTACDAILKDEEPDTTVPSVVTRGNSESSEEPSSVENKGELSGEITDQTLLSESVEQVLEMTADDVIEPSEKPDDTIPATSQGEEENSNSNPEESGSIESSTAQIDFPDIETTSTESQVTGGETSTNEVQAQTSPDKEENSNVSSPIEESSDTFTKETTTKGCEVSTKIYLFLIAAAAISPALVKQLRDDTGAGMMDCKKALSETGGDIIKAQEYLRKKGLASADKKASRATAEGRIGSYIHDSRIGVLIEVNCETDFVARGDIFKELVEDLAMQVAACPQKEDLLSKPEQIRSKIVDGRIRKRLEELALLEQPFIKDDKVVVKDWVKQTISTIGENIKVKRFVRYNLGEGLEKKSQDFAAEVAAQTASKPVSTPVQQEPAAAETKETVDKPEKALVSAALVKQLREETGAGMMDCKKALSETGGDLEKAQEYLRKKGLSTADKKSSRLAAEGRIGSYIHDSRIGVLIEVNCETDFVGRGEKFKELVDDLAMQVVACPQVQFVSIEDIPESIVNKEKQLEMQREDLQSKPESIREKIVEGRITKRLGELALLEQPFIKNDSILVKDLVKQTVAALGENIKVRRFVRFTLGEETSDAKLETEA